MGETTYMKTPYRVAIGLLTTLLVTLAAPGPKFGNTSALPPATAPHYTAESPLPHGWPQPGPFNQVARKHYPAYRAAFTTAASPNRGFWRLFSHIKQQEIPMSAPVEMKLDAAAAHGMPMEEMAFLYQERHVGHAGAAGNQVEVRDVPARTALSYAWQGARDSAAITDARAALDAALARDHTQATGYRLLGYNSPFVPAAQQTHELQALLGH